MCSCGFCLLNNVAIAAAYTRYKYGGEGVRVAIVDWDIHHGNGTQVI
jgi:acetoin utilization deacetylase AcuC-like enzyme